MSTSETPKIPNEQAPNQWFFFYHLYTPFGEVDTTPPNLIVIKGQNEAIGVSLEFKNLPSLGVTNNRNHNSHGYLARPQVSPTASLARTKCEWSSSKPSPNSEVSVNGSTRKGI